jgi:hypothetical protein
MRVNETRYLYIRWKWSFLPWVLAFPVIVGAEIGCAEGAEARESIARTVLVVGASAVSCVTWNRGSCNLLRMAQQREMRLSVGAIVSSVAVCVACVVVIAAEALDS